MQETLRHMTEKERVRAYKLRQIEELSYEAIAKIISEEAEDGRRFDRTAVMRACKKMPSSPLDAPFEWHLMDKFEIPWEAGNLLMEIFVHLHAAENLPLLDSLKDAKRAVPREMLVTPTFRDALWCWKVHLACPEVGHTVGNMLDIWHLAFRFAHRDLQAHILQTLPYFADWEAVLMYRPWINPSVGINEGGRHALYHMAIDLKLIPPVKDDSLTSSFEKAKAHGIEHGLTALVSLEAHDPEHPELLVSQQREMRKATGEEA